MGIFLNRHAKIESIIWSIAFPGFGQFLNSQPFKGLIFLLLEFLINSQSQFNKAIQYSFLGEIDAALKVTNFQWLMFYPCVYFFSMYDAYKNAAGETPLYSFLPFGFAAYAVTTGIMFSPHAHLFNHLLGPVWFPMICTLPGLMIGFILQKILTAGRYES